MIDLKRKQDCSGCTACMSICPKDCISMKADLEGFVYPITDIDNCINCNACNRVCPVIKLQGVEPPMSFPAETKAYAACIDNTEILLKSSSGGIFTALATETLSFGGAVYGAAWINGIVKHIKVESEYELSQLRGSKYVQSSLDDTFREIHKLLQSERRVLFSGTPCQVAGLKSYLNKSSDNLILVEVACHGAPSPNALQCYMNELRESYGKDIKLDFRSKPDGDWKDYKVTAYSDSAHYFYEGQKANVYMKGFLRELYSRPICHECPFKAGASGADITLADFWGIENALPYFPSKHGTSLVLTHTAKGEKIFHGLHNTIVQETSVMGSIKYNESLLHSESPHPERKYFFGNMKVIAFSTLVDKCLNLRPKTRLMLRLNAYLHKLGM